MRVLVGLALALLSNLTQAGKTAECTFDTPADGFINYQYLTDGFYCAPYYYYAGGDCRDATNYESSKITFKPSTTDASATSVDYTYNFTTVNFHGLEGYDLNQPGAWGGSLASDTVQCFALTDLENATVETFRFFGVDYDSWCAQSSGSLTPMYVNPGDKCACDWQYAGTYPVMAVYAQTFSGGCEVVADVKDPATSRERLVVTWDCLDSSSDTSVFQAVLWLTTGEVDFLFSDTLAHQTDAATVMAFTSGTRPSNYPYNHAFLNCTDGLSEWRAALTQVDYYVDTLEDYYYDTSSTCSTESTPFGTGTCSIRAAVQSASNGEKVNVWVPGGNGDYDWTPWSFGQRSDFYAYGAQVTVDAQVNLYSSDGKGPVIQPNNTMFKTANYIYGGFLYVHGQSPYASRSMPKVLPEVNVYNFTFQNFDKDDDSNVYGAVLHQGYSSRVTFYDCNITDIKTTQGAVSYLWGARAFLGLVRTAVVKATGTLGLVLCDTAGGAHFLIRGGLLQNLKADYQAIAYMGYGQSTASWSDCDIRRMVTSASSALYLYEGAVRLRGVTFQNSEGVSGVAIYSEGQPVIDVADSTFDSLTASGSGGVAYMVMYEEGGVMSFQDTTFTANTATYGGVVWAYLSDDFQLELLTLVVLARCTFDSNVAWSEGGAVKAQYDLGLVAEECTFVSNEAQYGGVFYTYITDYLRAFDCVFSNNIASTEGGVAWMYSSTDVVEYQPFSFAEATTYDDEPYYDDYQPYYAADDPYGDDYSVDDGADDFYADDDTQDDNAADDDSQDDNAADEFVEADYFSSVDSLFQNCTFEGNQATRGGAVYAAASDDDLYVQDCNSTGDTATYGGFMYADAFTGGRVAVNGSQFVRSTASQNGGGFYQNAGTLNVDASSFTNAQASTSGAALYVLGAQAVVRGATFASGLAPSGAAWHNSASRMRVQDSTVHQNQGNYYGAGMVESNGRDHIYDSTFTYNTFESSQDSVYGGALANIGGHQTVRSCTFDHNSASQGGAMYVNGITRIYSSQLLNSEATDGNGGALFVDAYHVLLNGTTVQGNTAEEDGGAVACDNGGFVEVGPGTTIKSNTAGEDGSGGAVYLADACLLVSHKASFEDNSAVTGGAVSSYQSRIILKHTLIRGNTAQSSGGGVYDDEGVQLVMYRSNLTLNTAQSGDGGALYMSASTCDVGTGNMQCFVSHTDLVANNASKGYGGALYAVNDGRLTMWQSSLSDNLASYGGGVYASVARADDLLLAGSSVIRNEARRGGGGLYWDDKEPRGAAENNTFAANKAWYGDNVLGPLSTLHASYEGEGEFENSGSFMQYAISVRVMDKYNNTIKTENDASITCSAIDHSFGDYPTTLGGTVSVTVSEGVAVFDNLAPLKYPGMNVTLRFTADSSVTSDTSDVLVRLRFCLLGEVKPKSTFKCVKCEYNTYSWNPGERECHDCPTGAVCYGGAHMKAQQGYWRFNETYGYYRLGDPRTAKHMRYKHAVSLGLVDDRTDYTAKWTTMTNGVCGAKSIGSAGTKSKIHIYDGDGGSPFGRTISDYRDDCSLLECRTFEACKGDYRIPIGRTLHQAHDGDSTLYLSRPVPTTIKGSYSGRFLREERRVVVEGLVFSIRPYERCCGLAKQLQLTKNFSWDSDLLETREVFWVRNEECSGAYQGNLCNQCSPQHGRSGSNICSPCPSALWVTFVVLALGFVLLVFVCGLMIYMQLSKEDFHNARLSIMMKIITSYMQLVSLFSQMDLAWPTIMLTYFEYTGLVASMSDRVINIECASKKVQDATAREDQTVSFFYQKLLFFMLTPIWVTLGCGVFWVAKYYVKVRQIQRRPWTRERFEKAGLHEQIEDGYIDKDEVKDVLFHLGEPSTSITVRDVIFFGNLETAPVPVEKFQDVYLQTVRIMNKERLILSVIVLLFMLHPSVSRYAFLSFTCTPLGDGKEFLQEDLDEQCNTPTHTLWVALVGIPGVLFYALGIPLLGYNILTSVKDKLDKPHVQLKYGFLYDGYEGANHLNAREVVRVDGLTGEPTWLGGGLAEAP